MPSPKPLQLIGKRGEQMAADYLVEKGYSILGRNIRTPYGEIDILARLDQILVFVEVKTRTSSTFGFPEISVSERKIAHMEESALHYTSENAFNGSWQLDVISITVRKGNSPEILHFENVKS